jgi:hypothetical protein
MPSYQALAGVYPARLADPTAAFSAQPCSSLAHPDHFDREFRGGAKPLGTTLAAKRLKKQWAWPDNFVNAPVL